MRKYPKSNKEQDRADITLLTVRVCVCVSLRAWAQRYGLWDHEGPLEEQSPSPESCKDEKNEDGGGKEERGEVDELDQLEKVGDISCYWLLLSQ